MAALTKIDRRAMRQRNRQIILVRSNGNVEYYEGGPGHGATLQKAHQLKRENPVCRVFTTMEITCPSEHTEPADPTPANAAHSAIR